MDRLPPLRLLTAFGEVARAGSMRAAAERLNVTQSAVTQSVRALEDAVGVPLLDRARRPAALTQAGLTLARATAEGLGRISIAVDDIRAAAGLAGVGLTVACTLGMATRWLMPRLPGFYALHPGITVSVQAPPGDSPVLAPGVDVALRYGTGDWADGTTTRLFDEVICPVGAPGLVSAAAAAGTALTDLPLIHVRSPESLRWAGWADYLGRKGLGPPKTPGARFDNYVQAVQEALNGRGLMLGWRSITGDLTGEGVLAKWPGGDVDFGTAYFLVEAPSPSEAARAFADWLRSGPAPARPVGV